MTYALTIDVVPGPLMRNCSPSRMKWAREIAQRKFFEKNKNKTAKTLAGAYE